MEEQKPNGLKAIFVRYKLLFLIYGIALCFAVWEIFGVPRENKEMVEGNQLQHLIQHIDEEGTYYSFQREKFKDRPEADFIDGVEAFRDYQVVAKEYARLQSEDKNEEAQGKMAEGLAHLERARGFFERAIGQGVISNEDLLVLHCATLKLLNVPQEEYDVAFLRLRRHFPRLKLPPLLETAPSGDSTTNMATREP